MKSTPTKEDIKKEILAAIEIIKTIGEIIRELGTVPSGVLYSEVSAHLSLDRYQKAIQYLKQAGLVKEENFVLTWIGPAA